MDQIRRLFSKKTDNSMLDNTEPTRYEPVKTSELKLMSKYELIKIIYRYDDDAISLNLELNEGKKAIQGLEETLTDYERRLKFFENKSQEDELRKELEALEKKNTGLKTEVSLLREENKKHKMQKDSILGEIKFLNNRLIEKEKTLSQLELALMSKKSKIAKLKDSFAAELKKLQEAQKQDINNLESHIRTLKAEMNKKENSSTLFRFKSSLEQIHKKILRNCNKASDCNGSSHSYHLSSIEKELNSLIAQTQEQLEQPRLLHRRKFSAIFQSQVPESYNVKHTRQLSNYLD